jgi:hypothetical protein
VHGKNLFYFFGREAEPVVMHFHFGMSGAFRTMGLPGPEPSETTRLRVGPWVWQAGRGDLPLRLPLPLLPPPLGRLPPLPVAAKRCRVVSGAAWCSHCRQPQQSCSAAAAANMQLPAPPPAAAARGAGHRGAPERDDCAARRAGAVRGPGDRACWAAAGAVRHPSRLPPAPPSSGAGPAWLHTPSICCTCMPCRPPARPPPPVFA